MKKIFKMDDGRDVAVWNLMGKNLLEILVEKKKIFTVPLKKDKNWIVKKIQKEGGKLEKVGRVKILDTNKRLIVEKWVKREK